MPTLNWIGKEAVIKHHKEVPFRMLEPVAEFSCGSGQGNLLPRGEEKDSQYKYEDDKGQFRNSDYTCAKTAEECPNLYYPVTNSTTGEEIWLKRTRVWAYSQEEHQRHVAEELIYWGKDGKGKVPAYKRYKHLLRNDGVVPQTLWPHEFAGHTDGSRKGLREVLHDIPSVSDFATPKPTKLLQRILQIATDKDSLILDSFAGSGNTGHAVAGLDGGNVLSGPVFDVLPKFAGSKVIYATANRMGSRAAREGITFKQTPYALEV